MKLEHIFNTPEQGKRLQELGIKGHSCTGYSWAMVIQVNEDGDPTGTLLPALEKDTSDVAGAEFESQIIGDVDHGYPDDAEEIETACNYPAFTVAELGQMLRMQAKTLLISFTSRPYWCWEDIHGNSTWNFYTEAEARASALIFALEQGYITAEEANKRLMQ